MRRAVLVVIALVNDTEPEAASAARALAARLTPREQRGLLGGRRRAGRRGARERYAHRRAREAEPERNDVDVSDACDHLDEAIAFTSGAGRAWIHMNCCLRK
jgi:hypothetical protein